jgi:FixJ family two-component response regulator
MSEQLGAHVILVEDDEDVRVGSTQALQLAGFCVDAFRSVEDVRPRIFCGMPSVVLSDVKLPGMSGVSWLQEIHSVDHDLPVILVTGHGDIAMAVQAMRDGAYDFLAKPFSSDHLIAVVRRAADKRRLTLQVNSLREQLRDRRGIESLLIGRSAVMERVRSHVAKLAETSADVVIYGETGTGKEVVARCLHVHGDRRQGNFVPLNCGGLPETLVESELFGHEVGSFTGATRTQIGKIEHAHGGTLFLDEIESSSCAHFKSEASSGSAPTSPSPSTRGSSLQAKRTCFRSATSRSFVPTCTTASASRSLNCPRCGRDVKTFLSCLSTSPWTRPRDIGAPRRPLRALSRQSCLAMRGPAMCASCATSRIVLYWACSASD